MSLLCSNSRRSPFQRASWIQGKAEEQTCCDVNGCAKLPCFFVRGDRVYATGSLQSSLCGHKRILTLPSPTTSGMSAEEDDSGGKESSHSLELTTLSKISPNHSRLILATREIRPACTCTRVPLQFVARSLES